jgi:hypothetical protein
MNGHGDITVVDNGNNRVIVFSDPTIFVAPERLGGTTIIAVLAAAVVFVAIKQYRKKA